MCCAQSVRGQVVQFKLDGCERVFGAKKNHYIFPELLLDCPRHSPHHPGKRWTSDINNSEKIVLKHIFTYKLVFYISYSTTTRRAAHRVCVGRWYNPSWIMWKGFCFEKITKFFPSCYETARGTVRIIRVSSEPYISTIQKKISSEKYFHKQIGVLYLLLA